MKKVSYIVSAIVFVSGAIFNSSSFAEETKYVFKAGDPSLKEWLLPSEVPYPKGNKPNKARIALGKKLFFDPRLSGAGNTSCATCHNPTLGWSDGLPTAKGVKSKVLGRASPTVINTAYNSIQMWDGRKKSLEDQAMGPMEATVEMNMDTVKLFKWLNSNREYVQLFKRAYPGEKIAAPSLSKAMASYERTVISNNSNFDRWVKGNKNAMTAQQVRGFKLFATKANCAACHSAPNFTDNGFHNIGLASWGKKNPDMGRYAQRPLGLMKGAFKTPTLREIKRTAPYFHDGSATTLKEVVEHYAKGGEVKTNLSPNMKKISLSNKEINDIVEFMKALSSSYKAVTLPELPLN